MRFIHFLLFTGFLSVIFTAAFAQNEQGGIRKRSQIIDDTTKQIYGPTTSRYFYEEDIFYNKPVFHFIDTLIRDFHKFSYYEKSNYTIQDLGNIGTASRSVFYKVPQNIGVTSGFTAYDLYWIGDRIRYFDTKSPYSNLKLSLGGKGRSITDVVFSRNINPRWNFGFDYRGLFIDKQIERRGKGDRNVRSTAYDIFTTYQSKDSTYRLFLNYARNYQQGYENGGVAVGDNYELGDFFLQNRRPNLTAAESRDKRSSVHLFHQYRVGSALQLYHKFDYMRQDNAFRDTPGSEPADYYDYTELVDEDDSTYTRDASSFRTVRNEVGIKGSLLKLFYNGYYAYRHYSMDYKYINESDLSFKTKGSEHYLGGRVALQLDSVFQLRGWGELLDNGNYRIEGTLTSKWLEASLKQNKYAPSFVQQLYRASHDNWGPNGFSDVDVTQLNGFIHYRSRWLNVSPGFTFTRLNNYVYFESDPTSPEQTVLPTQVDGANIMASPELRVSITFLRHITLKGQGIYTSMLENEARAIRIPELFVNGQLSYANIFFHGNLDMQAGVEAHWQSAYYAPGYDVPVQQFYNQNVFESPAYPLVDVFFNAKIKRGRIFLKYHNLVQTFTKQGYFPTPYYPGQSNIIDFGFDWSFYD